MLVEVAPGHVYSIGDDGTTVCHGTVNAVTVTIKGTHTSTDPEFARILYLHLEKDYWPRVDIPLNMYHSRLTDIFQPLAQHVKERERLTRQLKERMEWLVDFSVMLRSCDEELAQLLIPDLSAINSPRKIAVAALPSLSLAHVSRRQNTARAKHHRGGLRNFYRMS
jgi:hypothetical protein